jgi:UDP-N-acetyl-D-mannosaminuronate dehydrogenase
MPDYIVHRLILALNKQERSVRGSRFLLLGLAYKRNTSDARESPAPPIAEKLEALGGHVRAVDPHVAETALGPAVERVTLTRDELAAADIVVVLTDHDAFDRDLVAEYARLVFDTRHWLAGTSANVEFL